MTTEHAYDGSCDPAAPVLPLLLSDPAQERSVAFCALVDSGADVTVVPEDVVRLLGLPPVAVATVESTTGAERRIVLHAAVVRTGDLEALIEVVALGDAALIGRDVLNRLVVTLDGPRRVLRVR